MKNINLELENSIIGILFTNFKDAIKFFDSLNPDYFYQKINKDIIEKAKFSYVNKEEFTVFTTQEYLKSCGYADKNIIEHLIRCSDNVITKYDLKGNLKLLKELYQKRELEKLLSQGINDTGELDANIDKLLQGLYELRNETNNSNKRVKTMTDVSLEYLDFLANKEDGNRCDTGFPLIDSMLKGMFKGQLIGLAARPGCGKSAFSSNIALNVAKKGKTVAIFTQEMEAYEVYERMIANQAYIPMDNLIEKFDGLDETTKTIYYNKIISKSNDLSKLPIKIIDKTRLTTAAVRAECQQFKNLGLVIIDYLQLMLPVKREQNKNYEIAAITRELKILASDLGCPIMIISQLNRVKEETNIPSLNDYRDSGAIEQDLVKSMMLWKTDVENNKIGLIINKNRRGSTGAVELKFEGKYMMYTELGLYDISKAKKKKKKSDWSDFN